VHTPKGVLYVIVLKQCGETDKLEHDEKLWWEKGVEQGALVANERGKAITINKAHAMCSHMGQVEARAFCNYYGQEITKRGYQQCMSCGKAKAKQLPITQLNEEHEVVGQEGHPIFLDTSSVKDGSETKKLLSKPYWLLVVIEQSNFKVSEFLYRKKDLPEAACNIIPNDPKFKILVTIPFLHWIQFSAPCQRGNTIFHDINHSLIMRLVWLACAWTPLSQRSAHLVFTT
jgi:hypothetical protein